MFGRNPRLKPLQLRKQLLLAESELNRAEMAGNLAELTAGIRTLTDRAKSLTSIASSAVALLALFQGGKPAAANAKPSWLQTILKGAGLISTVLQLFQPLSRGRDVV